MRLLVFSDTHRNTAAMRDILARERARTDLVIHLGDCYTDLAEIRDEFPQIAFLGVRGNCDLFASADYPEFNTVTLENQKIYFTHGHMYRVKYTDELLAAVAARAGASIALYGHTHRAALRTVGGITVFNPGSLSEPRGGESASYGEIRLENGKALFRHIYLENESAEKEYML